MFFMMPRIFTESVFFFHVVEIDCLIKALHDCMSHLGSSDERSQCMFLRRNIEIYTTIIIRNSLFMEFCLNML